MAAKTLTDKDISDLDSSFNSSDYSSRILTDEDINSIDSSLTKLTDNDVNVFDSKSYSAGERIFTPISKQITGKSLGERANFLERKAKELTKQAIKEERTPSTAEFFVKQLPAAIAQTGVEFTDVSPFDIALGLATTGASRIPVKGTTLGRIATKIPIIGFKKGTKFPVPVLERGIFENIKTLGKIDIYKKQIKSNINLVKNIISDELAKANTGGLLSPSEKMAQRYILTDTEKAIDKYFDSIFKDFKTYNILSADNSKFAIPGMKSIMSADYHEAASALTKSLENFFINDKTTLGKKALFMAGGSGSAKSHILKKKGFITHEDYAFIYDINLNNFDSAVSKIDRVLTYGRPVEIAAVYRDPIVAYEKGVIQRILTEKRNVPIKNHVDTHLGFLPTVEKLKAKYGDLIKITYIDNTGAKDAMKIIKIDRLHAKGYTRNGLEDELYGKAKNALQKRQITEQDFEVAVRGSSRLEERYLNEGFEFRGKTDVDTGFLQEIQSTPTGLTPPTTLSKSLNILSQEAIKESPTKFFRLEEALKTVSDLGKIPVISARPLEREISTGLPIPNLLLTEYQRIAQAALKIAITNPESAVAKNTTEKVFKKIATSLGLGELDLTDLDIPAIAKKYNLDDVQLARMFVDSASMFGKGLNILSQYKKVFKSQLSKLSPEAQKIFAQIDDEPLTIYERFKNFYNIIDRPRRIAMVSQLATAARNLISQAGRYTLDIFDKALTGTIETITGKKTPQQAIISTMSNINTFFARFSKVERQRVAEILDNYPLEAAKLFRTPVADITLGGKLSKTLMFFNNTQEYFFRTMIFDSRITEGLRLRGLSPKLTKDIPEIF